MRKEITVNGHKFEHYGKLPIVLGGYSLAGLFARWAVCKEECFDAVAAASPSLWIVAWQGFSDAHEVYARYVYLSLGDREEITKNKAIAQVRLWFDLYASDLYRTQQGSVHNAADDTHNRAILCKPFIYQDLIFRFDDSSFLCRLTLAQLV